VSRNRSGQNSSELFHNLGIELQFHPEPTCFKLHTAIHAESVHSSLSGDRLSFESEGRRIELEMFVPLVFPRIEQRAGSLWPLD
jgi:hypothetical protein